jgi:hypothetical protein
VVPLKKLAAFEEQIGFLERPFECQSFRKETK